MWPFSLSRREKQILADAQTRTNTLAIEVLFSRQKILSKRMKKMAGQLGLFAEKVNAAFDAINVSVEGITSDVGMLKEEISHLQATNGVLSDDDKQILANVQSRAEDIATKLAGLDALTSKAPQPPPVGPDGPPAAGSPTTAPGTPPEEE